MAIVHPMLQGMRKDSGQQQANDEEDLGDHYNDVDPTNGQNKPRQEAFPGKYAGGNISQDNQERKIQHQTGKTI
jgi:hypothetical protein